MAPPAPWVLPGGVLTVVTTHHYSPFTVSPMSPVQVSPSLETDLGHSHSYVLIPWGPMTLARSWLWVDPAPALASLSLTQHSPDVSQDLGEAGGWGPRWLPRTAGTPESLFAQIRPLPLCQPRERPP